MREDQAKGISAENLSKLRAAIVTHFLNKIIKRFEHRLYVIVNHTLVVADNHAEKAGIFNNIFKEELKDKLMNYDKLDPASKNVVDKFCKQVCHEFREAAKGVDTVFLRRVT